MSKEKKPWMKFYPADWQSDERLRMCSPAARGLWVEMLCVMHRADTYGHLLVKGEAPTDAQLAVLTGIPSDSIPPLLAELEKFEVFSRTQKGVIYSRRQVRDEKKAKINRKNGENGGAGKHQKNKANSGVGNRKSKPSVKPPLNPQRPEARDQMIPPQGGDPPRKNFLYEGKIIRFLDRDWDRTRDQLGLTDAELARLADERDDFLARLPESDKRRVDWWIPTINDLKAKAAGVIKSRPERSA